MAPSETKISVSAGGSSLQSAYKAVRDYVSFEGQAQTRRQQRFDDTTEFLNTLSPARLKELSDDVSPRLGLAAKSIRDVQSEVDSLYKFLKQKHLDSNYPGTLENLTICKLELGKQFDELLKSARESEKLRSANDLKGSIQAAEPAFNLRTGNTVGGIIEDSQKVLSDIRSLQSLLEKEIRNFAEGYKLFIAPLEIRADSNGVVRENLEEFSTQGSIRDKKLPPRVVIEGLAPPVLPASRTASILKWGIGAAISLHMLNPKASESLSRLIGNTDHEFVALPKQPVMESKQREEGLKAYREILIGDVTPSSTPAERGYISKEMPKGFFSTPGLREGGKLVGAPNSSKAISPPDKNLIIKSEAADRSDPPSSEGGAVNIRREFESKKSEKDSGLLYPVPVTVNIFRNGVEQVIETTLKIALPPGVKTGDAALKSEEFISRFIREILAVDLESTGTIGGKSLTNAVLYLIGEHDVSFDVLFEGIKIFAAKEPWAFDIAVNNFEQLLDKHQEGTTMGPLTVPYYVVVHGASPGKSTTPPAALTERARSLGERFYQGVEQLIPGGTVRVNTLFLVINYGYQIGLKPTPAIENYLVNAMPTADLSELSKVVTILSGTGISQEQFSVFATRLTELMREKNYGNTGRTKTEETVIESLRNLIKVSEGRFQFSKEQLDGISTYLNEQRVLGATGLYSFLGTIFTLYSGQGLFPSQNLIEPIFARDPKQGRELQLETIEFLATKPEEFAEFVETQIRRFTNRLTGTVTNRERERIAPAQARAAEYLANKRAREAPPAATDEIELAAPLTQIPQEPDVIISREPRPAKPPARIDENPFARRSYYSEELCLMAEALIGKTSMKDVRELDSLIAQQKNEFTAEEAGRILRGFANVDYRPARSILQLVNSFLSEATGDAGSTTPREIIDVGDSLLRVKFRDPRIVSLISSIFEENRSMLTRLPELSSLAIRYIAEYGDSIPTAITADSIFGLTKALGLSYSIRLTESLVKIRPTWAKRIVSDIVSSDVHDRRGDTQTDSSLIKLKHLVEYFNFERNNKNFRGWNNLFEQALESRRNADKPPLSRSGRVIQEQLVKSFGKTNVEPEGMLPGYGFRVDFVVKDGVSNKKILFEIDGDEFHDTLETDGLQITKRGLQDSYMTIREELLGRKGIVVHLTWDEINQHKQDENWLPNKLREAAKTGR